MTNAADPTYAVDLDTIHACIANTIAAGDIVNFRFLFAPASPLRTDSPEDVDTPKYTYLFPTDASSQRYQEALSLVSRTDISDYVCQQLEAKGPPQLPWELVNALGDNAAQLGKYTSAAQAYELLRIRRRMQDIILDKADALLQQGGTTAAARGYFICSGLDYDYSAFPEPLPAVPNFQERALTMHRVYPQTPDHAPGMQPEEKFVKTALNYVLFNPEFSKRLENAPTEAITEFAATLIRHIDTDWDVFAAAYRSAMEITSRHHELLARINSCSREALEVVYDQMLSTTQLDELREIPTILIDVACKDWQWWQCVKNLAYQHPGAALLVARQRLSPKEEILIPRCRPDSKLAHTLGLYT